MAQTKTQISAWLKQAGLAPNTRLGQHFLIDGNLMRRLVSAAEIDPGDVVLEVGAGTGALTEELLPLAGHVVAVEVDRGLSSGLCERFASEAKLTLVHTDILESKSRMSAEVAETVREACARTGGSMLLVANLPYQIASPLLVDLALSDLRLRAMCFTVQREVAQRILAVPNTREYGPLGVVLQSSCRIRRIAAVPRQAFWPVPAVESTMMRMDVRDDLHDRLDELRSLNKVVKACFLHRRKTLGFNLRHARLRFIRGSDSDIDLSRRPQALSVEEWINLSRVVKFE